MTPNAQHKAVDVIMCSLVGSIVNAMMDFMEKSANLSEGDIC